MLVDEGWMPDDCLGHYLRGYGNTRIKPSSWSAGDEWPIAESRVLAKVVDDVNQVASRSSQLLGIVLRR